MHNESILTVPTPEFFQRLALVDIDAPPSDALFLGRAATKCPPELVDKDMVRHFFLVAGQLVATSKQRLQFDGCAEPEDFIAQDEFPIGVVTFLSTTIERFRLPASAGGFPPHVYDVTAEIDGQRIRISRCANIDYQGGSGYRLSNLSKCYGDAEEGWHMALDLSDFWLFDGRLLNFFHSLSAEYLRGEFGPVTWRPAVP